MTRTALLLLLFAPLLAAAPDAEARARTKLAKVWVDYARWCKLQDLKAEAEQALARAREADPEAKDLDRLAAEVAELAGEGQRDASFEKRREKAHRDAAKVYDQLARQAPEPKAQLYALEAVGLDPSKARLRRLAADAQKGLALIKHPDHPMVGWLSLPRGWKAGREYPVLVTVDGAGSNFAGSARAFASARGSRDWIVLAPCSFSNTNELDPKRYAFYEPKTLEEHGGRRFDFDSTGLEKLLEFVRERFGGAEKFAITGFSGGGNLCYGMTLLFPGRILVSVPACANFSGMGARGAAKVEGGGPPVRILTGEKDPHRDYTHGNKNMPGIEPQTDNAVKVFEELGFENFTRTMLTGVGHSNCAREVWERIDEVVGKR